MSITKKGKFVGNPQKAEIDTRFEASDNGPIEFGKGVELASGEDAVKEFAGGYFAGLALEANEKIGTDGIRDYDVGDSMKVLKKGIAYVELAEEVSLDTDGSNVSCESSTSYFGTGDSYTKVEGAEFLEGGSTGDEVRVRFNLPA